MQIKFYNIAGSDLLDRNLDRNGTFNFHNHYFSGCPMKIGLIGASIKNQDNERKWKNIVKKIEKGEEFHSFNLAIQMRLFLKCHNN